ncbi:hypothetical protein PSJ8397_01405 [Pseudooctadecabacter jejudonensis]|uniref:Uncharacterized protein n=1 Tax=Pseudooctadecabacter jejudonensis TaxID=1391910 RepID=A0A1Y5S466_9RHOB|nr:hypothetical protein PSJ8397_01405 [Pseudooctadecabacter jejudonensis]
MTQPDHLIRLEALVASAEFEFFWSDERGGGVSQ